MNFFHRQTFTISPNNNEARLMISQMKDWVVKECGVEPRVMESTTAIALEWDKRGVLEDEVFDSGNSDSDDSGEL